ncbi:MAG: hypothetical protein U0359_13735 [Byssovorax sp.]
MPETFAHYKIDRLDDAQIDDFVGRWYAHQIPSEAEAKEQADSLRSAIRHTPSVRRLSGNPLLLTLMAFIHQGLRKLPKDRGELYERCIQMLLKDWREAKRKEEEQADVLALNVPVQKDYLAHLAFFIQQKNQGGGDEEARGLVSRREAIAALSARHLARAQRERPSLTEIEARDEMARFLEHVCHETGLLLDRGNDQISFIHLSFQEYLAAWVFVCGTDLPKGAGFFVEHLGDPAWEEVLLLRLYVVTQGGGGGETELDVILGGVLRSLERRSVPEGWLTLVRAIRDDIELRERDRREILGRAVQHWLEEPAFGGRWFEALEEVKLFAERARELLRVVIAEARVRAPKAAEAIGLLHLETTIFAFPDDAMDAIRNRADLGEMLADLVPFADEPEVRALLAEKASIADWSCALRVLEGPEAYRWTVRWMKESEAPAAVDAATALLWDKILADFESRASFAESRRGNKSAVLFERSGALIYRTDWSSVALPYACLRVLPVMLPSTGSLSTGRLLQGLLAEARAEWRSCDEWKELKDWAASFSRRVLIGFPVAIPLDESVVDGLAAASVRSFVRSFGGSFSGSVVRSLSVLSFVPLVAMPAADLSVFLIANSPAPPNATSATSSFALSVANMLAHLFARFLAAPMLELFAPSVLMWIVQIWRGSGKK